MRELNIGEKQVRVRATPLALLFYKQEFKGDLLGDLAKMASMVKVKDGKEEVDISQLDVIAILQMTWAMAKADSFGKGDFPSFQSWLASFDSIDISDPDFMTAAVEEAQRGFFRSGVKGAVRK